MPIKIKFPVVNDVEYFDLIKNGTLLKSFGSDIDGFTWRQIQEQIGNEFGAGLFSYSLKFKNKNDVFNGTIRGIGKMKSVDPGNDKEINTKIESLKNQINTFSKDNISVDLLISITKQSYETQIGFLNSELSRKEIHITKLESKIQDLESECDSYLDMIEDLKGKTGINQYLEMFKPFLLKASGGLTPVTSLKESDRSDIPKEILDVIGLVDWNNVDQNTLDTIINYLKVFVQKLPLKVALNGSS